MIKYVCLNGSTCYSYQVLMEREFARQIFVISSNTAFMKIRPGGAELFNEEEQTDRQDEF